MEIIELYLHPLLRLSLLSFVMSADDTSSGRLITSDTGNAVFGYWGARLGTFLD